MAKTTVTLLTCDQCKAERGEDVEARETLDVGYEGYRYVLDLCPPHAEELHTTMQTVVAWSTERSRLGARSPSRRPASDDGHAEPVVSRRTAADRERLQAIRGWARANGYPELGNRGRIPQHIVDEYEAAHGG